MERSSRPGHRPLDLDWVRFQALARYGHSGDPDAMCFLRQALDLVCGTPLEPPTMRGYERAVVHRSEMETVIAETAERLGQLALDSGDPEQANWVAWRGLATSPYDERLYRLLMRAADAATEPRWLQGTLLGHTASSGASARTTRQRSHETVSGARTAGHCTGSANGCRTPARRVSAGSLCPLLPSFPEGEYRHVKSLAINWRIERPLHAQGSSGRANLLGLPRSAQQRDTAPPLGAPDAFR